MMQFATLCQATKSCDTKLYRVCWALVDTAGETEAKLSSQLGTLLTSAGMTWDEYADCDQELATSQTFEDDWERNQLATLNEEQTSDFG